MHGPNQKSNRIILGLDALDQFDAVAPLERDVDHGHIGIGRTLNTCNASLTSAASHTNHQIGLARQADREGFADSGVIIHDQNPALAAVSPWS